MATVSAALSSDQITSLIQSASAQFQAPATSLQAQEKPLQAQVSALGQVQSALSGLQSALAGLADVQTLSQRSVTTSPTGAVQASVTNDAPVGAYGLSGIVLANAESLVSSGSSASGTLGAGSLSIQVGSGSVVTINVDSGQSTLGGIAAAIDQAGAGVQASVVFDGSAYHLVLTGDTTGSANTFTVSGSGGLAGLSYSPLTSGGGLALAQAAANASFSLNGITVTSGSNTIAGVVPGLTFTLAASGSATVSVTQSVSDLDNAAQGVVSALNTALGTINKYTSYSAASGAGPLLGNVGLELVRTNILNAIAGGVGGIGPNSPYSSLSSVGFGVTSSGTVTLDDSAFQNAAQGSYSVVASLLGEIGLASNPNVSVQGLGSAAVGTYAVSVTTNSDGSVTGTVNGQVASGTGGTLAVTGDGPARGLILQIASGVTGDLGNVTISQGLFGSLSSIVGGALASGSGSVPGQLSSLNAAIASMNQQIALLQQQATQETLALTQQFSNAQATLSQLSTVSDFLSTYFNTASGSGG